MKNKDTLDTVDLDKWRETCIKLSGKTQGTKRRPENVEDITDRLIDRDNPLPWTDYQHYWYEPDAEGCYECYRCHAWTKRPELLRACHNCLNTEKK